MNTWADYLKSQGAVEDIIKVLDTPEARKAYDTMQAQLAESQRRQALADTDLKNYQNWFSNEATPAFESMKEAKIRAEAEAAKARQIILSSQEEGLLKLAKEAGWDVEAPATRRDAPPARTDDSVKYLTREDVLQLVMPIADQEGRAIATMGRMVQEHERLFPNGDPVDWDGLLTEGRGRKVSVEQVWKEKFGVDAAREARKKAAQEAYDKRLIEQGAAAERQRLADTYGNPNVRPLSPSASPFTMRPTAGRDKQPWEMQSGNENRLSDDRVARATKKLLERTTTPVA